MNMWNRNLKKLYDDEEKPRYLYSTRTWNVINNQSWIKIIAEMRGDSWHHVFKLVKNYTEGINVVPAEYVKLDSYGQNSSKIAVKSQRYLGNSHLVQ